MAFGARIQANRLMALANFSGIPAHVEFESMAATAESTPSKDSTPVSEQGIYDLELPMYSRSL